jgi:hypothetical protein
MTCPAVRPSTADARLLDAARSAGVADENTAIYGKSAREAHKAHNSVADELKGLTESCGAEAISMIAGAGSGLGAGAVAVLAGPFFTAKAMLESYHRAHEEAAELRQANARDAVQLAFVWAGAEALPRDYVAKVGHELKAVAGERGGATKILNGIMVDDARWKATREEANTHIGIGRKVAQRLGVSSREALDQRLAQDPQFAVAYRNNLGFFHGVQSVLFEAGIARVRGGAS